MLWLSGWNCVHTVTSLSQLGVSFHTTIQHKINEVYPVDFLKTHEDWFIRKTSLTCVFSFFLYLCVFPIFPFSHLLLSFYTFVDLSNIDKSTLISSWITSFAAKNFGCFTMISSWIIWSELLQFSVTVDCGGGWGGTFFSTQQQVVDIHCQYNVKVAGWLLLIILFPERGSVSSFLLCHMKPCVPSFSLVLVCHFCISF